MQNEFSLSPEEAFDEEFDRLVRENESCPICNSAPVDLGNIRDDEDNFILTATCGRGHMYIVVPQEDDGVDETG